MSYIKATAEVVMLDVQDVVTASYGYNEAKKLIEKLSPEDQERLLGGDNPILHNGIMGLASLLNDLEAHSLLGLRDDILAYFYNQGDSQAVDNTAIEAGIESFLCGDNHRDKYSFEEENDSFDSEW